MKNLFLVLCFFSSSICLAQLKGFQINGMLTSEENQLPMEAATVYLQQIEDSTLITYTISDVHGKFTLEGRTSKKKVSLYVSYVGYQTYHKDISLTENPLEIGKIALKTDTNVLDEVVVHAEAPITIKKDTLEFNVKSFKTKKDANIEDLLKELPGVEVDPDGKIKINGKEVNKVLVNGKPFFGDDPSIATRNLSKDIIEKIQVSDTKTDEEAFAGQEGSQTNKTVNLVVDKDKNKGAFGRLAGGAGTDDRYEFAGMYNYFNDDFRLSLLAGGNNINSPGFSFGEIRKMFGGSSYNINRQVFNYGVEGITTSRNQGLNYADDWGKKADISSNYFGSNSDSENEIVSERENIVPNGSFFTDLSSFSQISSEKHSTETKVKITLDSTLLITLEPKIRYTHTTNDFSSRGQSFDTNGDMVNATTSMRQDNSIENFFTNNINLTKRLGKQGSFLKFDFFVRAVSKGADNFLNNNTQLFGDTPTEFALNQFRDIEEDNNTIILASTYRIPLKAKELSLDVALSHKNNVLKNATNSFDFNDANQMYEETTDENLNSDFEYKDITTTPNAQLTYKKGKWNSSLKLDYILRTLENNDFLRPQLNLKRNFTGANISYNLNLRSPKGSMGFRYNLNNTSPQLSQLQPVVDVSNPLNIIRGNPELEPSNRHSISFYMSKNNFQKGTGIHGYVSSDIQNNNVVAKTIIDENLIRETTYTNVDGGYRFFADLGWNKKIKIDSLKSLQVRTGFYTNFTRSINFVNEVQYAGLSKTVSPNLGLTFAWKNVSDINVRYSPSFTRNSFNTDIFNDQEFLQHNITFRTTNHFSKKIDLRNEIRYSYNPNVAEGFQKSAWLWNTTLAYSFMKDKANLTFKVYDLLNQNTNVRRIANQNFIEDRQSSVLRRYFMLSFSWKFNTLGKAGETRNSSPYHVIN